MYKIKSANGTTVGTNQDIIPVMRAQTSFNGTSDEVNPFRPKRMTLSFTTNTTINVNGEGTTTLELDYNGNYTINLDGINVKTLTVADAGKVWKATFLF